MSASATPNPTRVPAGVPTGGQFAASAHAESGVGLGVLDRDALIADVLGPGDPLTDDQQRLLTILLDPQINRDCGYDDDLETMLEEMESHGHDNSWFGVEQVAERLHAYYERETIDGAGGFDLDLHRGGDYEISSYSVGVHLGARNGGGFLSDTHDSKYLDADRYDGSGLRKTLQVAENLDRDYQGVRNRARTLGLIPTSAPTTLDEAVAQMKAAEAAERGRGDQVGKATVTAAAFMVRDQYPDAEYIVFATPEDEGWSAYVHAVLDANRKPIAYPADTYSDPRSVRLQRTVMDLAPACPGGAAGEEWGDPDSEAWAVAIADVLSEGHQ